jgi:hypothetical protein
MLGRKALNIGRKDSGPQLFPLRIRARRRAEVISNAAIPDHFLRNLRCVFDAESLEMLMSWLAERLILPFVGGAILSRRGVQHDSIHARQTFSMQTVNWTKWRKGKIEIEKATTTRASLITFFFPRRSNCSEALVIRKVRNVACSESYGDEIRPLAKFSSHLPTARPFQSV